MRSAQKRRCWRSNFSTNKGKVGIYAGPGDIGGIRTSPDAVTGSVVLHVRLDPAFDPAIAKLTAENVGKRAQVFICGQLVTEPTVMSAIYSADFVISGQSMEEATRLAALLSDDSCGPPAK